MDHRISAEGLERLLLNKIATLLKTPTMLATICKGELQGVLNEKQTGEALDGLAAI